MSYCELYFFNDGIPGEYVLFKNAWGGAAYVWDNLYDKYLKNPEKPYDNWVTGNADALWALAKNTDVPFFMRAVHVATFDMAVCYQKDFKLLAEYLREFVNYFGTGDRICHLPKWADVIEKSNAEAVGFYQTSVSENLWFSYDNESGEVTPYNIHKGTNHLDVFQWLEDYK